MYLYGIVVLYMVLGDTAYSSQGRYTMIVLRARGSTQYDKNFDSTKTFLKALDHHNAKLPFFKNASCCIAYSIKSTIRVCDVQSKPRPVTL